MELILHIGGEKTGTTSLQRFLFQNSAELFERTRILYPVSPALCRYEAHFPVAAAFLPPGSLEFLDPSEEISREALQQEIVEIAGRERPQALMFSAEHFSSRMKRDEISRISQWFRALGLFERFTIVYYARPQDDLFVSALSTALLNGRNVWNTSYGVEVSSTYYNHLALAEMWEAEFGREAMNVRAYRQSIDIIEDFLDAIETNFGAATENIERSNEGYTYQEMRLLYLINQYLPGWNDAVSAGPVSDMRRAGALRNKIAAIIRNSGVFRDGPRASRSLPWEARERIRKDFTPYNIRLNEKYGCKLEFRNLDSFREDTPIADDKDILARALLELGKSLRLSDSHA
jgi:hypothetical protein